MSEEASAGAEKSRTKHRPLFVGLMLGAGATLVVAILSVTDSFKTLELKAYDIRLRRWPSIAMSDRIVMVDIDDASIETIGEFPFPRAKHATLVDELMALGADRVLFDVEFPDPSPPSVDREAMRRLINLPVEEINAPDVLRAIQKGEGDIEELFPQAIAKADKAVESVGDVRITTVDNDALFAAAIARADKVYVPFSLESTYIYSKAVASWYDKAAAVLRKNLETDGAVVAKAIGVAPEVITEVETSLKRRVIMEYLEEHDKEGTKGYDEICAALIPRERGGSKSFEEQLIETERDLYLGTLHAERIAGFVPDQNWGESIETFPEIRPAVLSLTREAKHTGSVNVEVDPLDGTLRRVRLAAIFRGKAYLQVAMRAVLDMLGVAPNTTYIRNNEFCFSVGSDKVAVPIDDDGMALINWVGGPDLSWRQAFSHIPYVKIYDIGEQRQVLEQHLAFMDERYLRGKRARAEADPNTTPEQVTAIEEQMLTFLAKGLERGKAQLAKVTDPARLAKMKPQLDEMEGQLQAVAELKDAIREGTESLGKLVKGRVCIIGSTARSSTDLKPTPVHPKQPAVTLYANLINMILQRQFLRQSRTPLNIALILFWGMLSTVAAVRGGAKLTTLLAIVLIAGNAVVSFLMFGLAQVSIALMSPLVAQVISFSAVTAYRQLTEERDKRQVRNAFEHYLSPEVVRQVANDPEALSLGGEMRELTILFSDIQGFSTVSESMTPPKLVEWLNEYLSEMSQTITDNGGCVDKYEGDLIMAFFGAPLDMPDHAARACLTMLENRDKLAELRKDWDERGMPPIYARVGMNSDEVLVGNLGSKTRLNYSVIGDGVNLAARLEPANKIYGTYLMVTGETYEQAKDAVVGRELDWLRVVGRATPVSIYELIGEQGRIEDDELKGVELFAEGLAYYREREFEKAIEKFQQTLGLIEDDPPSTRLIARCEEYLHEPPPDAWDGVFDQTSKE